MTMTQQQKYKVIWGRVYDELLNENEGLCVILTRVIWNQCSDIISVYEMDDLFRDMRHNQIELFEPQVIFFDSYYWPDDKHGHEQRLLAASLLIAMNS